jgi:plasmid stability protein
VDNRNITLSLPADLIRQAKVYAAAHDKTINGLVRELLSETLSREARQRLATDRFLALALKGPYSDVDPSTITRDEMHERR